MNELGKRRSDWLRLVAALTGEDQVVRSRCPQVWRAILDCRFMAATAVAATQLGVAVDDLDYRGDPTAIRVIGTDGPSALALAIIGLSGGVASYLCYRPQFLVEEGAMAPILQELLLECTYLHEDTQLNRFWRDSMEDDDIMQAALSAALDIVRRHWVSVVVAADELGRVGEVTQWQLERLMLRYLPECVERHPVLLERGKDGEGRLLSRSLLTGVRDACGMRFGQVLAMEGDTTIYTLDRVVGGSVR